MNRQDLDRFIECLGGQRVTGANELDPAYEGIPGIPVRISFGGLWRGGVELEFDHVNEWLVANGADEDEIYQCWHDVVSESIRRVRDSSSE